MDEKTRKHELTEVFFKLAGATFDMDSDIFHQFECELNGWEGLIVYGPSGLFYQMNYKGPDIWSITMFPYDIYGRKVFEKDPENKSSFGTWKEAK